MTTIWERVTSALTTVTQPKAANFYQAATGADLPDEFLVYFLVSSLPEQHADDAEIMRSWRVQISYYSRMGLAGMPDIDTRMTAAGFTRGPQREIPYNQLTGHFGLALEYVYLEQE